MSDAQHAATTRELVRLTLGGRPDRTELLDWERHTLGSQLRELASDLERDAQARVAVDLRTDLTGYLDKTGRFRQQLRGRR